MANMDEYKRRMLERTERITEQLLSDRPELSSYYKKLGTKMLTRQLPPPESVLCGGLIEKSVEAKRPAPAPKPIIRKSNYNPELLLLLEEVR